MSSIKTKSDSMNEIQKEVVKMDKKLLHYLQEKGKRKRRSVFTVELLESLDELSTDDVLKIKCDKKKANAIKAKIKYHTETVASIEGKFEVVYKEDEKIIYIFRKEM